jgi:hypothetical protein
MARRRSDGSQRLVGRWRIQEMDLWDRDTLDLIGPAFIEFRADQTGNFGFIAVEGWMDCRPATIDDRPGVEFSWGRQRRMRSGQWTGMGGSSSGRLARRTHLLPYG